MPFTQDAIWLIINTQKNMEVLNITITRPLLVMNMSINKLTN